MPLQAPAHCAQIKCGVRFLVMEGRDGFESSHRRTSRATPPPTPTYSATVDLEVPL